MPSIVKCILGCEHVEKAHLIGDNKRKQWLKILNMEDCPLKRPYICSRHFSKEMYSNTFLQRDAVPNINLKPKERLPFKRNRRKRDADGEIALSVKGKGRVTVQNENQQSNEIYTDSEKDEHDFITFDDEQSNDSSNYFADSSGKNETEQDCPETELRNFVYINEEHFDETAKLAQLGAVRTQETQTSIAGRRACALVDVAMDSRTYTLSCFECSAQFLLSSWQKFVLHLAGSHSELFNQSIKDKAMGLEVTSAPRSAAKPKTHTKNLSMKQTEISSSPEIKGKKAPQETSDDEVDDGATADDFTQIDFDYNNSRISSCNDDYGDGSRDDLWNAGNVDEADDDDQKVKNTTHWSSDSEVDADLDVQADFLDMDLDEFSSAMKTRKRSRKKIKSEVPSMDDSQQFLIAIDEINLNTTEPKVVLSFLESVKKCPELWLPRSRGNAVYDNSVSKLQAILKIKENYSMSAVTASKTLLHIYAWYRKITEFYKRHGKFPFGDTPRLKYYNLITEIIRLGKPLTLKCQHCTNYYLDRKTLKNHEAHCEQHQTKEKAKTKRPSKIPKPPSKCQFCGVQCKTSHQLEEHIRTHRPKQPSSVDKRDSAEQSEFQKRLPSKGVIMTTSRLCKFCGLDCETEDVLTAHEATHTAKVLGSAKCKFCGLQCENRAKLKAHERTHSLRSSGEGPASESKQSAAETADVPAPSKPALYKCDMCDRSFTAHTSLRNHRATHFPAKFTCETCGKAFHGITRYRMHVKMHSQIKDYICDSCGREFYDPRFLYKHKVCHHGEPGFRCPKGGCRLICRTAERLEKHIKKKHSDPSQKQPKPGNKTLPFYACYECGMVFLEDIEELRKHRHQSGHRRDYKGPVNCVICQQHFTKPAGYRRHLINRHRDVVDTEFTNPQTATLRGAASSPSIDHAKTSEQSDGANSSDPLFEDDNSNSIAEYLNEEEMTEYIVVEYINDIEIQKQEEIPEEPDAEIEPEEDGYLY